MLGMVIGVKCLVGHSKLIWIFFSDSTNTIPNITVWVGFQAPSLVAVDGGESHVNSPPFQAVFQM